MAIMKCRAKLSTSSPGADIARSLLPRAPAESGRRPLPPPPSTRCGSSRRRRAIPAARSPRRLSGQASRPPPTSPPSTRIASGQSNVHRLFRRRMHRKRVGQRRHAGIKARGAPAAAARPAQARPRIRRDRNGRHRPACRRPARPHWPSHARTHRPPRARSPAGKAAADRASWADMLNVRVRVTPLYCRALLLHWYNYSIAIAKASRGQCQRNGRRKTRRHNGRQPRSILVCSCEDTHAARCGGVARALARAPT